MYVHMYVFLYARVCAWMCLCNLASCFETSGKYICLFLHLLHCTHCIAFCCLEGLVGYDQHIRLLVVT